MYSQNDENIAAIAYHIAVGADSNNTSFYDKFGEELEGETGVIRYVIDCAEQFTLAEHEIGQSFDWYLAIDGYTTSIIEDKYILLQEELRELAVASITKELDR